MYMQKAPFIQRLENLLAMGTGDWTPDHIAFFKARVSYLNREQVDRVNRAIVELNKSLSKKERIAEIDVDAAKKARRDRVAAEAPVVEDVPTEEEIMGSSADDEEVVDDESDPDMPDSDDGDLEIVDDEDSDQEEGESEGDDDSDDETEPADEEEVDIDEMNLEQLQAVAKDLGIKGVHFFKDPKALREKILATYEASSEGKAQAESGTEAEVL